jgi:glycosyltransferase involved in cell wall biosynthesis
MFSYANGPANFAVNLHKSSRFFKDKNLNITFFTEDIELISITDVRRVKLKWSKWLGFLSMLGRPIDYRNALDLNAYNVRIWNFSLVAYWALFKKQKIDTTKDVVFVNDPFSVDSKGFEWKRTSIRYWVFRKLERYSCRKSDLVIVNSEVLKKLLVREYDLSPKKVKVLLKGIDFEEIKVEKQNYEIDLIKPIKICFVKSNHVSGGLQLLCNSLRALNDYRFVISIIGPGYIESFYYEYENVQIDLKGRLPKNQVYEIMASSDIFFVPFLLEAFGQVNMEAIKIGVPTIILPTTYQLLLHDPEYVHIPKSAICSDVSTTIRTVIEMDELKRSNMARIGKLVVGRKYDLQNMNHTFVKMLLQI